MGRIYVLSGPSGVGKTTFLEALFSSDRGNLRLIPRFTDRPIRAGETEGFENYFTTHLALLQMVFANDFIHIEKWGDYYSGIERRLIEETIESSQDGLVLTSVFGAARLRASYGSSIVSMYLWTDHGVTLRNAKVLDQQDPPEVSELHWRIRKKLHEDRFSQFERSTLSDEAFVQKRMVDNRLDIAAVNGRLRANEDIQVLANRRDKLEDAIEAFERLRWRLGRTTTNSSAVTQPGVFVLMPSRPELDRVYRDHIVPVCQGLTLPATRADQIFSVRPYMQDIREAVSSARFVIADLTQSNPNVFYELGICHALGKDVILITQETSVPSDLSHIRYIRYVDSQDGLVSLDERLRETLRFLLAR